jgi:glycosyl transferase family 25
MYHPYSSSVNSEIFPRSYNYHVHNIQVEESISAPPPPPPISKTVEEEIKLKREEFEKSLEKFVKEQISKEEIENKIKNHNKPVPVGVDQVIPYDDDDSEEDEVPPMVVFKEEDLETEGVPKELDRFFYINLDKRKDRMEEFLGEYKKMNLPDDKLERFPAILNAKNPDLGCLRSHLSVLKLAKERGYKFIVIFEDDFEFLIDSSTFSNNLKEFFSLDLDFKAVMLSYNMTGEPPIAFNKLVGITHDVQTASGYIVNMNYSEEFINCLEYGYKMLKKTGEHWNYMNDQVWKSLQKDDKWYYFMDRVGKQRKSFSNLANSITDYGV